MTFTKGMTPIEKNINVVDEHGHKYQATYYKRAIGLVKHGRARFIDDSTICLACPPTTEMEEHDMSNNDITITKDKILECLTETRQQLEDVDKILFKVQCVRESQDYVQLENEDSDSENIGTPLAYSEQVALEKIQTIRELALTRESTLKQLIEFYINLYQSVADEKSAE